MPRSELVNTAPLTGVDVTTSVRALTSKPSEHHQEKTSTI